MAMRKPFTPGRAGIQGDAMMPGQPPMPPQAGRAGPQMPMPMGGNPGMQGATAPGGGGPTSPLNIGQMLQPQVQTGTLAPWGDSGTRPAGPSRVPFDMNAAEGGAEEGPAGPLPPGVMLQLMRKLGRI